MSRLTTIFLFLFISGCVSINAIPDSASEIDFSQDIDEMKGWRTYEKSETFNNTSYELACRAAKGAMLNAGYEVSIADIQKGAVIGKNRTTWLHYERVAGIYLNQMETDVQVRIIIKTIYVPPAVPDTTMSLAAQDFLQSMRLFIDSELRSDAAEKTDSDTKL